MRLDFPDPVTPITAITVSPGLLNVSINTCKKPLKTSTSAIVEDCLPEVPRENVRPNPTWNEPMGESLTAFLRGVEYCERCLFS